MDMMIVVAVAAICIVVLIVMLVWLVSRPGGTTTTGANTEEKASGAAIQEAEDDAAAPEVEGESAHSEDTAPIVAGRVDQDDDAEEEEQEEEEQEEDGDDDELFGFGMPETIAVETRDEEHQPVAYDADTESSSQEDGAVGELDANTESSAQEDGAVGELDTVRRLLRKSASTGGFLVAGSNAMANESEDILAGLRSNDLDRVEETLDQMLAGDGLVAGAALDGGDSDELMEQQSLKPLDRLRSVGRDERLRQRAMDTMQNAPKGFYDKESDSSRARKRVLMQKIRNAAVLNPDRAEELQREAQQVLGMQPKAQHLRAALQARREMRRTRLIDAPVDARGRRRPRNAV